MSDSDKPGAGPAVSRALHDQVNVVGINRGDRLDGDDGVTYSYRAYKVQKFL